MPTNIIISKTPKSAKTIRASLACKSPKRGGPKTIPIMISPSTAG